jgi:hypothetical protein
MSDHQLYLPQMLLYSSRLNAVTGIGFLSLVSPHTRCRNTVRRSAMLNYPPMALWQIKAGRSRVFRRRMSSVQSMPFVDRALCYMVAKVSRDISKVALPTANTLPLSRSGQLLLQLLLCRSQRRGAEHLEGDAPRPRQHRSAHLQHRVLTLLHSGGAGARQPQAEASHV